MLSTDSDRHMGEGLQCRSSLTYANTDSLRWFHYLKAIKRSVSWLKRRWLWHEENCINETLIDTSVLCDSVKIILWRCSDSGLLLSAGNYLSILAGNNDGNMDTRLYLLCIKLVFVKNKETWLVRNTSHFRWLVFFFFFSFFLKTNPAKVEKLKALSVS